MVYILLIYQILEVHEKYFERLDYWHREIYDNSILAFLLLFLHYNHYPNKQYELKMPFVFILEA